MTVGHVALALSGFGLGSLVLAQLLDQWVSWENGKLIWVILANAAGIVCVAFAGLIIFIRIAQLAVGL